MMTASEQRKQAQCFVRSFFHSSTRRARVGLLLTFACKLVVVVLSCAPLAPVTTNVSSTSWEQTGEGRGEREQFASWEGRRMRNLFVSLYLVECPAAATLASPQLLFDERAVAVKRASNLATELYSARLAGEYRKISERGRERDIN